MCRNVLTQDNERAGLEDDERENEQGGGTEERRNTYTIRMREESQGPQRGTSLLIHEP